MKKIDTSIIELSDSQLPEFISVENKHLFPEDVRHAFDLVQSKQIVFSKRYLRAQKRLLKREMNTLLQKHPNLSLKKVLIELIQPLPDFIPADLLSELCSFVIDTWKKKISSKESPLAFKK